MGKKRETIKRMLVIVSKLKGKQRYVSKEQLLDYVSRRMVEFDGVPVDFRTIQRDFNDIYDLLGFVIKYDKQNQAYYISEEDKLKNEQYERLLLNFELLSALGESSNLHSYVLAEHHRPVNNEYLSTLMMAIKYSHPVSFDYIYVRDGDKIRTKVVRPHYIKEDQSRWYLLAYEGDVLKTFSVDCMSHLSVIEDQTFMRDMNIDVDELFRFSYGIWNQQDIPIEEIELAYSPLDGKFIKNLPLHHSQIILEDTEEVFRIQLTLRITNDFVMALLARSSSLTVIRPLHLRERIRKIYEEALERNQ